MPASIPRNTWQGERAGSAPAQVVRHRFRPGRGWAEHRHAYAEVFWVESGGGQHWVDGVVHELRAGDVWCLGQREAHAGRAGRLGLTIVNVSFRPDTVATLAQRHRAIWPWRGSAVSAHVQPSRMERLHAWAAELGAHRRQIDLDSFLLDLARLLEESGDGDASAPPWLREALDAFRDPRHLAGGTARLARLCGRTEDHLNRVVRRWRQRTATDLVNDLRIDHAAAELRLGDRPIAAIAQQVGLANLGHFYACFGARYGTTPRRYRAAARQAVTVRAD